MSSRQWTIRPALHKELRVLAGIQASAASAFATIPDLAESEKRHPPLPIKLLESITVLIAVDGGGMADPDRELETSQAELEVASLVPTGETCQIVGFIALRPLDSAVFVAQVSVCIHHQRKGVGSALLACAVAEAKKSGATLVSLITFTDIPWNDRWYEKMGFTVIPDTEILNQIGPEHAAMLQKSRTHHERPSGRRFSCAVASKILTCNLYSTP